MSKSTSSPPTTAPLKRRRLPDRVRRIHTVIWQLMHRERFTATDAADKVYYGAYNDEQRVRLDKILLRYAAAGYLQVSVGRWRRYVFTPIVTPQHLLSDKQLELREVLEEYRPFVIYADESPKVVDFGKVLRAGKSRPKRL